MSKPIPNGNGRAEEARPDGSRSAAVSDGAPLEIRPRTVDTTLEVSPPGEAATAPEEPDEPTVLERLQHLAQWKEALLLLAPAVYLLGYVAWTYHAWCYNLGALPALQLQYLIAGIAPGLILAAVWLLLYKIKSLLEAVGTLFLADAPPWKRRLRPAVAAFYATTVFVFLSLLVAGRRLPLPLLTEQALLYGSFYCVSLGFIIAFRLQDKTLTGKMRFSFNDWHLVAGVPLLLCLLLITVYVRFVFPNLPPELGGALPRIATLDVDRDGLSAPTRKALVQPEKGGGTDKSLRTREVYVFFACGDFLLVKPYVRWTDNRTYEIETKNVKGITWLDRDGHLIQRPAQL